MFPISDSAPRASPAYIIITLIMINAFVFLWMLSLPPRALAHVTLHYALIPLRYADPIDAQAAGLDPNDWWPLLTNTFMHGGWLHLILNMWTLWIFGPAMEARFGRIGGEQQSVGRELSQLFALVRSQGHLRTPWIQLCDQAYIVEANVFWHSRHSRRNNWVAIGPKRAKVDFGARTVSGTT
jgi:membrane associated rhomboid family serine protease